MGPCLLNPFPSPKQTRLITEFTHETTTRHCNYDNAFTSSNKFQDNSKTCSRPSAVCCLSICPRNQPPLLPLPLLVGCLVALFIGDPPLLMYRTLYSPCGLVVVLLLVLFGVVFVTYLYPLQFHPRNLLVHHGDTHVAP